jgi:hypothetical protein
VVNQFWFSASTFVVTIATFAKPENVGGNFTETHNKMDTINIKQTVGQSIQEFYDKYDFGEEGGVNEKYAWIKFGFFSIPIPNAESRRNNIYLHDINHIVTGNNTTWEGESAVAAWEIATGGWNDLYLPWLLTLWAMGLGVLFYPKNVLKSFRNGLTMNNALTCGLPKTEIYKLSILELRQFLSNKPKSDKNPYVWMFISFMTFLTPFIVGFIGILTIIKLF